MAAPSSNALVVETPERVALTLEVAGLGHRVLAYLVDWFILFFFWMGALLVASLLRQLLYQDFLGLSSLVRVLLLVVGFVANWTYDIAFEVLWHGQTPGKRLLRIRVVRDDGSPVGFVESAARNLARLVDSFPLVYGVGVIAMLVSPRSRRLGDYLAGTLVVSERRIDLSRYAQAPAQAAVALSAREFELVASYAARAQGMAPEARARVARKLAEPLAARLPEAERTRVLASDDACHEFLASLAGGPPRHA